MNIKPFIQSEIKVIFLSIIKNQQLLKCFSYLNEIRFHTEFSQLCRNLISTVRKASFFFSPFLLNTEKTGPIVWGGLVIHTHKNLYSRKERGESLAKSCGRDRVYPRLLLLPSQSLPTLCLTNRL